MMGRTVDFLLDLLQVDHRHRRRKKMEEQLRGPSELRVMCEKQKLTNSGRREE